MRYMSICSGVEAASLAWQPLGWQAVAFSEIEPFPCEVLKQRFPNVPNLGDLTKIEVKKENDKTIISGNGATTVINGRLDVLVGGTPCQSFSIAGQRKGLDGASGLAMHFVRLLKEVQPRYFIWENVPGALSSKTKGKYDFNFLLSAFAECGFNLEWRVLDAQHVRVDGFPHAIPQRRRRLFVVGHNTATERGFSSVLFDRQSGGGDTPPERVSLKAIAGNFSESVENVFCPLKHGTRNKTDVSGTLTLYEHSTGNGCHLVTMWNGENVAPTLTANSAGGEQRMPDKNNFNAVICFEPGLSARLGRKVNQEISPTLRAEMGDNQPCIVLNDQGGRVMNVEENGIAGTLRANTHGNEQIICYENHANDSRIKEHGDISPTLNARIGTDGGNLPLLQQKTVVRRLTPVECERLMGFPDNWTQIEWRNKSPEQCPDAPRYKACGNSMCVNVMRWIGMRIEKVENEKKQQQIIEGRK